MISRYTQKDISEIWSDESKFNRFKQIESAISAELFNNKILDHDISAEIDDCVISINEIEENEKTLGHDVLAFCHHIESQISPIGKRLLHYGVTSSDLVDTSLMLALKESNKILMLDLSQLKDSILVQIEVTKELLTVGRTHGIYAEPMIFAHKWLSYLSELNRRILELRSYNFSGQISGAIGVNTIIPHDVEEKILKRLNLSIEEVSTQVIPRDRILSYVQILVKISVLIERISVEFRHLQHSDIAEVYEGFSEKQKGSSVMPHKKNPISFENLCGISRQIQALSNVSITNCALWHERDLTHSSNERMYLSDIVELSSYSIRRLTNTINNLVYRRDHIENKVWSNPSVFSSRLLAFLVKNTEISRDEIYRSLQQLFFKNPSFSDVEAFISSEFGVEISFNKESLKNELIEKFNNKYISLKERL